MASDVVRVALSALADRIAPSSAAIATAKARFRSLSGPVGPMWAIADRLCVGSHARDTAVRQFSDVDLLLVLEARCGAAADYRPSPALMLDLLRRELGERLDGVELRKERSSVVVRLVDPLVHVEVLPAFRAAGLATGCPVYDVPDGAGGYRRFSPRALANYVARVEGASAGAFRRLVRYVKWWAATQSTTMATRGFYFELAMAHGFDAWDGLSDDAARIHAALARLATTECAPVGDPTLTGRPVTVCTSGWRHRAFVQAVRRAEQRVAAALAADSAGRTVEALALWGRVFRGVLPVRVERPSPLDEVGRFVARGA